MQESEVIAVPEVSYETESVPDELWYCETSTTVVNGVREEVPHGNMDLYRMIQRQEEFPIPEVEIVERESPKKEDEEDIWRISVNNIGNEDQINHG